MTMGSQTQLPVFSGAAESVALLESAELREETLLAPAGSDDSVRLVSMHMVVSMQSGAAELAAPCGEAAPSGCGPIRPGAWRVGGEGGGGSGECWGW